MAFANALALSGVWCLEGAPKSALSIAGGLFHHDAELPDVRRAQPIDKHANRQPGDGMSAAVGDYAGDAAHVRPKASHGHRVATAPYAHKFLLQARGIHDGGFGEALQRPSQKPLQPVLGQSCQLSESRRDAVGERPPAQRRHGQHGLRRNELVDVDHVSTVKLRLVKRLSGAVLQLLQDHAPLRPQVHRGLCGRGERQDARAQPVPRVGVLDDPPTVDQRAGLAKCCGLTVSSRWASSMTLRSPSAGSLSIYSARSTDDSVSDTGVLELDTRWSIPGRQDARCSNIGRSFR